jgi:hypothetical protein
MADKEKFTRELAELTGLDVGSDELKAAHQKLCVFVHAEPYSPKILEAARKLAAIRIHQDRFKDALSDAVFEGRALPPQRPALHRFFCLDPEAAVSLVWSLYPVVPGRPKARRAPQGVDQHSFDLDRRIHAYAVEHNCDNATALHRVMAVV